MLSPQGPARSTPFYLGLEERHGICLSSGERALGLEAVAKDVTAAADAPRCTHQRGTRSGKCLDAPEERKSREKVGDRLAVARLCFGRLSKVKFAQGSQRTGFAHLVSGGCRLRDGFAAATLQPNSFSALCAQTSALKARAT